MATLFLHTYLYTYIYICIYIYTSICIYTYLCISGQGKQFSPKQDWAQNTHSHVYQAAQEDAKGRHINKQRHGARQSEKQGGKWLRPSKDEARQYKTAWKCIHKHVYEYIHEPRWEWTTIRPNKATKYSAGEYKATKTMCKAISSHTSKEGIQDSGSTKLRCNRHQGNTKAGSSKQPVQD